MDPKGLAETAAAIFADCPSALIQTSQLDVTDTAAQHAAFANHVQRSERFELELPCLNDSDHVPLRFGSLDVAILNAGISERGVLLDPATRQDAAQGGWQATLDVDLTAVIAGLR